MSNLTDAAIALRKYEIAITEHRKLILEAIELLEKDKALNAEGKLRKFAKDNNFFGGTDHVN